MKCRLPFFAVVSIDFYLSDIFDLVIWEGFDYNVVLIDLIFSCLVFYLPFGLRICCFFLSSFRAIVSLQR